MGLRVALDELQRVDVRGKTISELSKYVDAVTYVKTLSGDKKFIDHQLRQQQPDPMRINVTSLGNLAYIGFLIKIYASGLSNSWRRIEGCMNTRVAASSIERRYMVNTVTWPFQAGVMLVCNIRLRENLLRLG